jgi:translation initiation factor IF-3
VFKEKSSRSSLKGKEAGQSECSNSCPCLHFLPILNHQDSFCLAVSTLKMRHSKSLLTPGEALLRIYVPLYQPRILRRNFAGRPPPPKRNIQPFPNPSYGSRRYDEPRYPQPRPADPPQLSAADMKLATFTLNEAIEARFVQVKRPDGSLSEPVPTLDVLRNLQPGQVLREHSPQGQNPDTAVCEITTRQALLDVVQRKADMAEELQKQMKRSKPKMLELNWAIGPNDLELKLKKMAEFLQKGKKVEILLAARKHQRKATEEEAEAVLDKLRDKIQECGAKEILPLEGKILGQVMMTVQKPKES